MEFHSIMFLMLAIVCATSTVMVISNVGSKDIFFRDLP